MCIEYAAWMTEINVGTHKAAESEPSVHTQLGTPWHTVHSGTPWHSVHTAHTLAQGKELGEGGGHSRINTEGE